MLGDNMENKTLITPEWLKRNGWVKVGSVWASGEAYTKTTTSSSTANASGQVQVNVSTS